MVTEEITRINSLVNLSAVENLEKLALGTRIFVSMPLVHGITPRVLVEKGNREPSFPTSANERLWGVFKLDEVGLPLFDHGLLYGDGIFEGILVKEERLFQWREHVERLYASAERLRIQIPYTQMELTQHIVNLADLSTTAGVEPTYLRLVVTRGPGDLGINPTKCVGGTVYCIASKIQLYPESLYEKGVDLAVAKRTRRSSADTLDPQIKSCNYLNNILALLETSEQRAHEALMLSPGGFVSEATTDNIFRVVRYPGWENDPSKVIVSTPIANCCLKGITRELVLSYAKMLGFQVDESDHMVPSDLVGDDKEVFLTGTGAGLVPVVTVDGRMVSDGVPGPVTRKLRDLLNLDMATPVMGLSIHGSQDDMARYLQPCRYGNERPQEISSAFIRRMFATIDARNWEGLATVFDDSITYERPGYEPLVGYERVQKFYREERVIASGRHMLEGIVVDSTRGACWGRFVGKHKNGSEIDEGFADAYTFHEGKVRTRRSFFYRPAV